MSFHDTKLLSDAKLFEYALEHDVSVDMVRGWIKEYCFRRDRDIALKVHKTYDLGIDFETFSRTDLKKAGVYRYAEDPSTEVLCAAYAFNDGDVELWVQGQPCPPMIVAHVLMGGIVRAWNAQFERVMWRDVLGPRYNWPVPDLRQYRCTMVRAYAMNLPGKLDDAAVAVKLDYRKDAHGGRVMLQLCKPKPSNRGRYTAANAPEKFAILYRYCKMDVEVERGVGKRVIHLNAWEQELYWIDQEINDRGILIDFELAEKAGAVVKEAIRTLDLEMKDITDGAVASCSSVAQLKEWLTQGGVSAIDDNGKHYPIDTLDKDALNKFLVRDDLTDAQYRSIELRYEAGRTSTSKLNTFRTRANIDGRVRGTLQFCGAGQTLRWAARGLQVQNFPRPDPVNQTNIPAAIADILRGTNALGIEAIHGPPLIVVSDCLRGMLIAEDGKELGAQDASQIEARVLPWLAGDRKKLDAFRAYDAKTGPDIYIVAAAMIYGVDVSSISKKDFRRLVGKVCELALGFGGGVGAFVSMAKVYRLDVAPLYDSLCDMVTSDNYDKAHKAFEERGKKMGIRRDRWIAAEMIKLTWRDKNEPIVAFWKALEEAAIAAVLNPGKTFWAGKIGYRKTGSFLRCTGPHGGSIYYPYPEVKFKKTPWGTEKLTLSYMSISGITHKWQRSGAYGGLLGENATQWMARNVFGLGLVETVKAGYEPIMLVHDEEIEEHTLGFGSSDEMRHLMTQGEYWTEGLPIAAGGWRGPRYKKDD